MRFIFLPLLLGHVVGDFYCQTNNMAQQKTQKVSMLLLHMLIYTAVMASVLSVSLKISMPLIVCLILASVFHGVIDLLKFFVNKTKTRKAFFVIMRKYGYFVDQALHLVVILILTVCFYDKLSVNYWQTIAFAIPALPMVFFTGIACLLKPVSITISEFFNVTGLRETLNTDGDLQESFLRAGNYIGMLERLLVFLLIIHSQYAAIGFLMTAKTITRFKDLEKRNVAEYYLIGTLLSMAAAFFIALICK